MSSAILTLLREQTRALHAQLEGKLDLMSPQLTLASYRTRLAQFYRFYQAAEPALLTGLREIGFPLDYTERQKIPALERDLKHLAVDIASPAPSAFRFDDPAEAVGLLYVIEGSTLGGQIISRHLRDHLGLEANGGATFFNGYGPQTPDRWRAFVTQLAHFADAHPASSAAIVTGAQFGFSEFALTLG